MSHRDSDPTLPAAPVAVDPAGPEGALDLARRDFLKAAGFSVGGALLGGCGRAPVERAIPFLVQPEEVVPGRSYVYASVCGACSAGCGTLVRCRDGRPVKLEGNPEHPLSRGGLCAVGQASLLEVYDARRLRQPLIDGKAAGWAAADARLAAAIARGGRLRVLTRTLAGPTERRAMAAFLARFPDARHVEAEPLSAHAILEAHARTHGVRALPRYRFDRATAIASFDADFLGAWLSPVDHAAGWAANRRPAGDPPRMSWHVQLEPRMTLTGGRADRRLRLLPGEIEPALAHLVAALAARAGEAPPLAAAALPPPPLAPEALAEISERLWAARGTALVVAGANDVATQVLVNHANRLLDGYGGTVDLARALARRDDDAALAALLAELERGEVDLLVVRGLDPVHDLPRGAAFAAAARRTPLVVAVAEHRDDTAGAAQVVLPEPHFLAAWGDAEPAAGIFAVQQPTVGPLGPAGSEERTFAELLARWSGAPAPARELVRATWREEVHPRVDPGAGFDAFWDAALERGWVETPPAALADAASAESPLPPLPPPVAVAAEVPAPGGFALALYAKVGLLDGRHAENPWLQELPDPISKVTWDNYACLSPEAARGLGVAEGDLVRVSAPGVEPLTLPALVQPGQHDRVVAVALGYGKAGTDRFATVGPRWLFGRRTQGGPGGRVGVNAAGLARLDAAGWRLDRADVRVERAGGRRELAATQHHHTLEIPDVLGSRFGGEAEIRRPIVQETTLAAFAADRRAGAPEEHVPDADLWLAAGGGAAHERGAPHRWAMAVDLNLCTGCSACVLACQAENNVPVVGQDEVRRGREMHWMRLDRYYEGEGDATSVAHQPMLCQHCGNAPCETVCPVIATAHSAEGLNQQVYNRCVGTRYCANNCPYKVRRFNWFDYPHEDHLANLALNPDVTVRSRGVMEKCSLCVQRLHEAKLAAKTRGTPLADGEAKTACQQSCPSQAIVFGDLADPASRIAAARKDPRHYRVLEELHVEPRVGYLRLVRNRPAGPEEARRA